LHDLLFFCFSFFFFHFIIYEEDSQRCYGYESDYFIGTDSFKFCPICGKEARILWKEPDYIAKQLKVSFFPPTCNSLVFFEKSVVDKISKTLLSLFTTFSFFVFPSSLLCRTRVTIEGVTREMWLPVMSNANKAMKLTAYKNRGKIVEPATMTDINKTIMRCLVKNLSFNAFS
jgi:hypothetical protein